MLYILILIAVLPAAYALLQELKERRRERVAEKDSTETEALSSALGQVRHLREKATRPNDKSTPIAGWKESFDSRVQVRFTNGADVIVVHYVDIFQTFVYVRAETAGKPAGRWANDKIPKELREFSLRGTFLVKELGKVERGDYLADALRARVIEDRESEIEALTSIKVFQDRFGSDIVERLVEQADLQAKQAGAKL